MAQADTLNHAILYVRDTAASAAFYGRLLGQQPTVASPEFALFALPDGFKLGLWQRDGVQPPATAPGGGELSMQVADEATVRSRHAEWVAHGAQVLQAPTALDFGFSFTAADPDGHRLRVYATAGA